MKKVFFLLSSILYSQNTYQGQVLFEYSGTESGSFTSTLLDSTISGFSLSQTDGDSSSFLIASVTQQDINEFDLFLAVLQDTSYPLEPRVWDIPGEGDEDNPLSLESLVVFLPKLYLGLQGELEIEAVTDSSVIGLFNAVLIKPAFYFPPHTISITNGEFQFFDVELPMLNSTIENGSSPNYFEISSVYPNPFNSATNIEVLINSNNENTSLYIVDITGKKVQTIFNEKMEEGRHLFSWNSNQNPSGIYFSVLKTNNSIKTLLESN